jgi:hypothetical protein
MRHLIAVLAGVAAFFAAYLVAAFAQWSFNPGDWDASTRITVLVVGWFLALGAMAAAGGVK